MPLAKILLFFFKLIKCRINHSTGQDCFNKISLKSSSRKSKSCLSNKALNLLFGMLSLVVTEIKFEEYKHMPWRMPTPLTTSYSKRFRSKVDWKVMPQRAIDRVAADRIGDCTNLQSANELNHYFILWSLYRWVRLWLDCGLFIIAIGSIHK